MHLTACMQHISADDPSHTLDAIASLPGLKYEGAQPAVCHPEHARGTGSCAAC